MALQKLSPDGLRPRSLESFIGQSRLKQILAISLAGCNARGEPMGHCLFVGPPGLGKTTLANIIAEETQRPLIVASATSVSKLSSLLTILNQLPEEGGVVFIDEIHRLPRAVEEALYSAMEDFRIDVTNKDMHINMHLPRFTLAGATTRQGLITKPMRDRFLNTYQLDWYSQEELEAIVKRFATILKLTIEDKAASVLAARCKRTPRLANNLVLQARDFASSMNIHQLSYPVILGMMDVLEIDSLGLTRTDRLILDTIITKFRGGPVGLDVLSAMMVEEQDVLENVYEPYLMQQGLLERTPRGRCITRAAFLHMKKQPPQANGLTEDDLN